MGKQNRQRRLDKQRKRQRTAAALGAAGPKRSDDGDDIGSAADLAEIERLLVSAASWNDGPTGGARAVTEQAIAALSDRGPVRAVLVAVVAEDLLQRALRAAWARQWEPADLERVVRRTWGSPHRRLTIDVMAAACEHESWARSQRWAAQLEDIGASTWWGQDRPLLTQWAEKEALPEREALSVVVELLGSLLRLPELEDLGASNGAAGPVASHGLDPRVLSKVRALLAKAESTTFPEEAEALTAKAQQLMARHAIDEAVVDARRPGAHERPMGRRIGIDDPYADAKSYLLARVGDASGCRCVYSPNLGFSTVFGFAADLDAVELLYSSLLVQATTALVAAGSGADQRARRTRTFRRSFLVAFASRIGERLREATAATVVEAEVTHGSSLLPVLAARTDAVDEAFEKAFPTLKQRRFASHDRAGWAAGTVAAELASLGVATELDERGVASA